VDGAPALAIHRAKSPTPAYFILLEWYSDRLAVIRDFRYVPYIATDASFQRV
jgi:hypothetical protein